MIRPLSLHFFGEAQARFLMLNGSQIRFACAGATAFCLPGLVLACGALLLPEQAFPLVASHDLDKRALLAVWVATCLLASPIVLAAIAAWHALHRRRLTQPWALALLGLIAGLAAVFIFGRDLIGFWNVGFALAGILTGLAVWAITYAWQPVEQG